MTHEGRMSWEQAVEWLRQQPDQQALVEACYFDDPLLAAAERFAASAEWQATLALLPDGTQPGAALDLGAGRGISSYALAQAGWQVHALEPDPSPLVGGGAIRALAKQAGLAITVVEDYGERLPFESATFDLVHGRQVLHHAADLPQLLREVARVLKPGGLFIATREHVLSRPGDLPAFLESHALHRFYGGENAFLLSEYTGAITGAGLTLQQVLSHFESVINYFPMPPAQVRQVVLAPLTQRVGWRLANWWTSDRHAAGRRRLAHWAAHTAHTNHTPGRLYTFVAGKPRLAENPRP